MTGESNRGAVLDEPYRARYLQTVTLLHHLQKWFGRRHAESPEKGGFLVGLFGTPADLVAVRLVERLAGTRPLRLARVMEAPRDQSLPELAPDQEIAERKRLRLGRLSHANLQLTSCRNPGKKFLEIASATAPELLVVALSRPADETQLALLRWILKESQAELLLIEVGASTDLNQPTPSHVVVPMLAGASVPRHVLGEAVRLAGPQGCVEVVGILVVPRSLSLDAPLAGDEESLNGTVRDAVQGLADCGNKAATRILRGRDFGEVLCRLRAESPKEKIILEWSPAAIGDASLLENVQHPTVGISLVHRSR